MKKLFIILLLILFSACYSLPLKHNRTVILDKVTVNIVVDKSQLPCGDYGCAQKGNIIWIIGKETDDGIDISDLILGHEMRHLLKRQNSKIKDPHKDWKWILFSLFRKGEQE